jgi:hypothetical protein
MTRAVFAQGSLVVERDDAGAFVVAYEQARARVEGDTVTVVSGDADHPVVAVVSRALAERVAGWFHVHAGLVGDGTLIAGASGAGKTTTTLALSASAGLLGDDVVFVQRRDDRMVARALPRPLHVGDATLRMFPYLRPRHGVRSLAGKFVVDGGGANDIVDVTRVVFPRVAAVAMTTAQPLPAAEALPLLLQSSATIAWSGLPRTQEHLVALGALARLPAFRVTLGRDALADPQLIVTAVQR